MAIGVLRTRDMESARILVEKSFGNFVRRKRVGPAQVKRLPFLPSGGDFPHVLRVLLAYVCHVNTEIALAWTDPGNVSGWKCLSKARPNCCDTPA